MVFLGSSSSITVIDISSLTFIAKPAQFVGAQTFASFPHTNKKEQGRFSMAFSKAEYQRAFNTFKQTTPQLWNKYASPAAEETVVEFLVKKQHLPSRVTVRLAIDELLQKGLLSRTDGGSERSDWAAARATAEKNLDQAIRDADAAPLTRAECEEFAS